MANGFSSFASDHHYASGIILVTVGVVGVIGSTLGTLPSMIAALWVPDILFNSSGIQADTGGAPTPGNIAGQLLNPLNSNPAFGGITQIKGIIQWATGN